MPTLKMMDGTNIPLTEEQAAAAAAQWKAGVELLPVLGCLLNTKTIGGFYTDAIERLNASAGRLRDGQRVIRRFGEWRDAGNPELRLNPAYYPEIERDAVMTEAEYQREIAPLPTAEARGARYDELTAPKAPAGLAAGDRKQLPPGV